MKKGGNLFPLNNEKGVNSLCPPDGEKGWKGVGGALSHMAGHIIAAHAHLSGSDPIF